MITQEEISKIKISIEEFFQKMTIEDADIQIKDSSLDNQPGGGIGSDVKTNDAVTVDLTFKEPQFLIGQNGQTLFELERILRIVLNKKLEKNFYVALDINNYKAQKIEYVKNMANEAALEVVRTKEKKVLPPMSSYERRLVHMELAGRQDVATESYGEGIGRCIVINPR